MRESIYIVLLALICASLAKNSSPVVQVYSHKRGEYEKPNTLICHVANFHPPLITIELFKDEKPIVEAKETDLAFGENWNYHMTKYANFTPKSGERYTCAVTHMGKTSLHIWEADV